MGHHVHQWTVHLLGVLFSFLTFFVAIPTAIKVFSRVATLYKGHVSYTLPMMHVHLALFMVGGLTKILGACHRRAPS